MLMLDDGETFPSLYHLWSNIEFRHSYNLITEADLFFPEQRVAVFCDSIKYHRSKKRRDSDDAISEKLRELGIRSVRLNGGMIVDDLKGAADLVIAAL